MFSFEDDACASAKEYLAQLESFYSGKESGAEVMEGIEERMAELLIEKSGQGGVVSQRMVSDVIAVLGRPEAIEEDPDAPGDPSGAGHSSPESGPVEASGRSSRNTAGTGAKPRRRLYRDPANGKLAGVCSGLGTFFNFDPSLFRILFVVFTLIGFLDFRLFWPFEPWIHISRRLSILYFGFVCRQSRPSGKETSFTDARAQSMTSARGFSTRQKRSEKLLTRSLGKMCGEYSR